MQILDIDIDMDIDMNLGCNHLQVKTEHGLQKEDIMVLSNIVFYLLQDGCQCVSESGVTCRIVVYPLRDMLEITILGIMCRF